MASHILVLLASLALLIKCADWLVEFGAHVARRLGVSDLVIGLTLTSIGTSVPELASSVSASLAGNSGLVLGNVVGSNIANIGLIAGLAAVVRPFPTDSKMHDRDGLILLATCGVFFVLVLDNQIQRLEAIAFLIVYVAYIGFVALSDKDQIDHQFRYFLSYVVSLDYVKPIVRQLSMRPGRSAGPTPQVDWKQRRTLLFEIAAVIGSCAGVVIGAHYLVREASWLALTFGVPDALVGLSIVAVGTSLPELMVALAAARKGNAGMVIGNVMGSNLANILLILGIAGTLNPLEVAEVSVVYTIPIMLFFTIALLYFVKTGWRVTRANGVLALLAYTGFMVLAFLFGWG